MAELDERVIRLRPYNLVKVLWEDLLRTEAEIGMECEQNDYRYEFYSKVCEVRQNLLCNGYGVILTSGLDDLCRACDYKDEPLCKLPDSGDSSRQFMDSCGLEMNVPYASRDLLGRIRGYAEMQTGDPMAILKRGFLDLIILGNKKLKQHGGRTK